jgi:hypothetical protein
MRLHGRLGIRVLAPQEVAEVHAEICEAVDQQRSGRRVKTSFGENWNTLDLSKPPLRLISSIACERRFMLAWFSVTAHLRH